MRIFFLQCVKQVPSSIANIRQNLEGDGTTPSDSEDNFYAVFDHAYEIGFSWTTVHARTVEQKYKGSIESGSF